MNLDPNDVIKVLVSLIIGGLIGLEREYRTKPAGFRTLILICVGSTLFTIMSIKIGGPANPDRIASYIIAGIGFLGAGAIFKEGFAVKGLTTAATIWLTAGLGMSIGDGDYLLSVIVLLVVFVTLEIFTKLERWVDHLHQSRVISITFKTDQMPLELIESEFQKRCKIKRVSLQKKEKVFTGVYKLEGGKKKLYLLFDYLINSADILGFDD